jgi:FtsH-binding integral membrane protein
VGISALGHIAMWAPLVMLLVSAFAMRSPTANGMQAFYWAFVAVNGVGLSLLMLVYTGESLMRTFFITAAAFAALSLYGYTTRRSLSGFGSFLVMGLIGLLIAMVVNIFLASAMMQFVISAAGVLIFAGLTAYDTQRIKEQYSATMGRDAETITAVWGALNLYITFLNLFQFLLMFLGNRE